MSLQDLITVLKGGKGSGDWGHSGRPGKRGGSGGGGGLAGLGLKPGASITDRISASTAKKIARIGNGEYTPLASFTDSELLKELERRGLTAVKTETPKEESKAKPVEKISNLRNELFDASGSRGDSRFNNWAKRITTVDRSQNGGYMFKGDFVNDGAVRYKVPPKGSLYLTATTEGSRRNQITTYSLLKMDSGGKVSDTGIYTKSTERGWANRLLPEVDKLLEELK